MTSEQTQRLENAVVELVHRERRRIAQETDGRQRRVEARLEHLEDRIERDAVSVSAWQTRVEGRLDGLESRFGGLEAGLKEVRSRCDQILLVAAAAFVGQVVLRLLGH